MAKNYQTGLIITGSADGAIKATKLTEQALKNLNNTNKRTARESAGAWDKVKAQLFSTRGAIGALGTALAGLASINALRKTIDEIDQIGKMSQRLGTTTEALSELRHVANLSGVDFNQLQTGFQRMTRRISEAAGGTGEAVKALQELGLNAKSLKQLRPEDQFERIADAINGLGNQSDRVRIAMRLFDTEGVALIQTMGNGAKGIREMREEAQRLGLTITQDMADAAAQANDNMARFGATMDSVGLSVTNNLLPVINNFFELFDLGKPVISDMELLFVATFASIEKAVNTLLATAEKALLTAEAAFKGLVNSVMELLADAVDGIASGADLIGADGFAASMGRFADSMRPATSAADELAAGIADIDAKLAANNTAIDDNVTGFFVLANQQEAAFQAASKFNQVVKQTAPVIKDITTASTQSAKTQQAQWDQLVKDANKYYDLRQEIARFSSSDVTLANFEKLLGKVQDYLNEGIIDEAQAKQQFDALGVAFNEGYVKPAIKSINEFELEHERMLDNLTYELQFAFDTLLFSGQSFTDALGDMFDNMIDRMLHAAVRFASDKIIHGLFSGSLSSVLTGVGVGALAIGASYLFGGGGGPDRPAPSRTTTSGDDRAQGFAEFVAADIAARDYFYARQLAVFNEMNHTLKSELSVLTSTGALSLDQFTDLTKAITGQLPPAIKDLAHSIETGFDSTVTAITDSLGLTTPVTGSDVTKTVNDAAASQKLSALTSTLTAAYEIYNLISNWSDLSTFSKITGTVSAITAAVTAGVQVAAALGAGVSSAVLNAIPVVGWVIAAIINVAQAIQKFADGDASGGADQLLTGGVGKMLEGLTGIDTNKFQVDGITGGGNFFMRELLGFGIEDILGKKRTPHARLKTMYSRGIFDQQYLRDHRENYGDSDFLTKRDGSSSRVRIGTPLGVTTFGTFNANYSSKQMVDMFGDLLLFIRDTDTAVVDAINNIDAAQGQAGKTLQYYYEWLQRQGGNFSPKQNLDTLEVAGLLEARYEKIIDVLGQSGTAAGAAFDRWFDVLNDKFGPENVLSIVNALAKNFEAFIALPTNLIDLIDDSIKSHKLGGTPEDAAAEIQKVIGSYAALSIGLAGLGANINDRQIVSFLAQMNKIGFAVDEAGKSLLDYAVVLRALNQNIAAGVSDLIAYANAQSFTNAQLSNFITAVGAFASLGQSLGFSTSLNDLKRISTIIGDIAVELLDAAERDTQTEQAAKYGSLSRTEIEQLGLATKDAILQIVNEMTFLQQALDATGNGLRDISDNLYDVVKFTRDFIDIAGGIEEAEKKWNGYFNAFYSDLERAGIAANQTAKAASSAIASLNITGLNGDNFRSVFESSIPSLSAEQLNRWLEVAAAIGTANDAADAYKKALEQQLSNVDDVTNAVNERYETELRYLTRIRDYVDSLTFNDTLSPLTNQQKFVEAKSQYKTQLAAANAGDLDALNALPDIANSFLRTARDVFASSQQYTDVFNFVRGSLSAIQPSDGAATFIDQNPANPAVADFVATQPAAQTVFDNSTPGATVATSDIAPNLSVTMQQSTAQTVAAISQVTFSIQQLSANLSAMFAGLSATINQSIASDGVLATQSSNIFSNKRIETLAQTTSPVTNTPIAPAVAATLTAATPTPSPVTTPTVYRIFRGFATGGIATEASIFGESGPEAAVPLPDGRTIPVTLNHARSVGVDNSAMIEELRQLRAEVAQLRSEQAQHTAALIDSNYDANEQAAEKVAGTAKKISSENRWRDNKVAPA